MSQRYSSVAVVGGGASGMIAALTAAEVPGRHVLLLERQQRIGRKLLATGNGRCNLSNRDAARLTISVRILLLPPMRSLSSVPSIRSGFLPISVS